MKQQACGSNQIVDKWQARIVVNAGYDFVSSPCAFIQLESKSLVKAVVSSSKSILNLCCTKMAIANMTAIRPECRQKTLRGQLRRTKLWHRRRLNASSFQSRKIFFAVLRTTNPEWFWKSCVPDWEHFVYQSSSCHFVVTRFYVTVVFSIVYNYKWRTVNGRRSHRYWSLSSDSSTHSCVRSARCVADRTNSFSREGGRGSPLHHRRRLHAFFTVSSDEGFIMSKCQSRYPIVHYVAFVVVWRQSRLCRFHGVYIVHYGFDQVECNVWTFFVAQNVQIRSVANFFRCFFGYAFCCFFSFPSASRIEYILGRRPTNFFIRLPLYSSFIFPNTRLFLTLKNLCDDEYSLVS